MFLVRENYDTPAYIQDELTRRWKNPYGEAKFRLIWGWRTMDWVGGEIIDYDQNGNHLRTVCDLRYEPKFLAEGEAGLCRWYIEKWMPPETYGHPRLWALQTETAFGKTVSQLGPYPSRGKYETSLKFEDSLGRFVDPTLALCVEHCKRVIISENFSLAQRLAAIKLREEREQREKDSYRKALFSADGPLIEDGRNPDFVRFLEKEN